MTRVKPGRATPLQPARTVDFIGGSTPPNPTTVDPKASPCVSSAPVVPSPPVKPGSTPVPRITPTPTPTSTPYTGAANPGNFPSVKPCVPVAPIGAGDSADDSGDSGDSGGTEKLPVPSLGNPLTSAGNTLDDLIKTRISEDVWRSLRGKLPCWDSSTACVTELQNLAIANNSVLTDVQTKIDEATSKITEAQKRNQKTVTLELIQPVATEVFKQPSPLDYVLGLILKPLTLVNSVLSIIGTPLITRLFGGSSAQTQTQTISLIDLQTKVATLQVGKAQIADKIRVETLLELTAFDESAREFQITQELVLRNQWKFRVQQIDYKYGGSNTPAYLALLANQEEQKAKVYRSWVTMRSHLLKLKLLALGVKATD